MTDPTRHEESSSAGPPTEAQRVIAVIEQAGKSLYYIAKLMHRQMVQIQRMKKTGRCQPHELKMLEAIAADVSHGTLQNVTISTPQAVTERA